LRSMFLDVRLGTNQIIPSGRRLEEIYRLSNERCLYLRLTSPHEAGEHIGRKPGSARGSKDFLNKTSKVIVKHVPRIAKRWNFASALQPNASNNMPDAETTCRAFVQRFRPERTRIVILSPDRHGEHLPLERHLRLVARLMEVPRTEICSIDARHREMNGLFLADFFDFT